MVKKVPECWVCQICGVAYESPQEAEQCELKHEQDEIEESIAEEEYERQREMEAGEYADEYDEPFDLAVVLGELEDLEDENR